MLQSRRLDALGADARFCVDSADRTCLHVSQIIYELGNTTYVC